MLPLPVPPGFRIIAHRGASAYAPENTLPAFALAHKMGVTEVELDAQLTCDGQIVLCHDTTLERYGHGPRTVEAMRWDELAGLDMGAWFSPYLYGGTRLLALPHLFDVYHDLLVYHIEIKGTAPELPEAVHAALGLYGLYHRAVITSFSAAALAAVRALDDQIRLGWLVRTLDAEAIAQARDLQLFQLCPLAAEVNAHAVARAQQVVPEVRAWGLAGETTQGRAAKVMALIRQVVDAGCTGMTLDWPDWVRHAPG
jgi:glycerophosphoryl diester phosphodiesterase